MIHAAPSADGGAAGDATGEARPISSLPRDDGRGTPGMLLVIATEATLFLMFFFAYGYLGAGQPHWPPRAPKYAIALFLLGILLSSSLVLHLGERAWKKGADRQARALVWLTVAMGVAFLVLQSFEYRAKLKELRPTQNAYGSIFYTLTGFHAAHVVVGVLMLAFVGALPTLRPHRPPHRPPHRAMHNASLYWHFVDAVWLVIVLVLYVLPQVTR
jgi:heme/copper-type cytochrome/quinol oxidase subunit 3